MVAETVARSEWGEAARGPMLRWGCIDTELGTFVGIASAVGLSRLILPTEFPGLVEPWAARLFPGAELRQDDAAVAEVGRQLRAYLDGQVRSFVVPLDPRGTDFQRRVWAEVARIPYGETRSYQQIATAVGAPRAVRAVGACNAANPLPIIVPCHRVVGSDGSLTGYGGGLALKQRFLELEFGGPPRFPKVSSTLRHA